MDIKSDILPRLPALSIATVSSLPLRAVATSFTLGAARAFLDSNPVAQLSNPTPVRFLQPDSGEAIAKLTGHGLLRDTGGPTQPAE